MVLSVTDMWNDLKSDIGINLKTLINDDSKKKELKEVFTLMLSMLGTTKIKQPYNEVSYDRKASLET